MEGPSKEQSKDVRRDGDEWVSVKHTARSYARGMAGGLLVAMPLLATMEMWWIGFYMPPFKMILFLLFNFGVLMILEYYSGFRETVTWSGEFRDALAAYGIGFFVSAMVLFSLHLLRPNMSLQEILGKIILESIPISIGVSIAISQLGQQNPKGKQRKRHSGFWGREAVALAGGLYFGFNIAPTVEPMMMGLKATWWSALLVMLISLVQVYALIYAVDLRGGKQVPKGSSRISIFFHRSVTSYVIALLLAAYLLWTFGRLGADTGLLPALHMTIIMGFVTSLGAAAGKLIL